MLTWTPKGIIGARTQRTRKIEGFAVNRLDDCCTTVEIDSDSLHSFRFHTACRTHKKTHLFFRWVMLACAYVEEEVAIVHGLHEC